ncbi:hypothetical protein [uncultured Amnibacterium sp.]|uniref:hypothetical protein n=1 Tax=uncultured Amnibacterium sp. TaxID=1631851 RepID=UPI0035CB81DE
MGTALMRAAVLRTAVITVAAALVVGGLMAQANPRDLSLFDALTTALLGSTGTYLQFIGSSVLFVGCAYLLSLRYTDRTEGWLQLELLRCGTHGRWLVRAVGRASVTAAAFPVVLALTGSGWYVLYGGRTVTPPSGGLAPWVYQLLVNGTLQLVVYLLVLLAATIATPNRIGGIASAAILLALGFPQRVPLHLLPVQLSGMGYSLGGWQSTLSASLTLAVTTAAVAAAALLLLRRRRRSA